MKPILHTDIHREMDSIFAPEQVASIIEAMPLNISILESDSDRITFQHHTEDMLVDGIIQRWQGTESHIEIVAEVSQALLSNTRRNAIITLSISIASMISFMLIYLFTKVTCVDLGVTGACYAYDGLSYWEIVSLLAIIWLSVGTGLWFLIKRDTKIAKRWQVQQKLGVIVEQIFNYIRQQEADSHTISSLLAEEDELDLQIQQAKRDYS